MVIQWYIILLFIAILQLMPTSCSTQTSDDSPRIVVEGNITKLVDGVDEYIVPERLDEHAELFTFSGKEYIFLKKSMKFRFGRLFCQHFFKASLAIIKSYKVARFLAEALSETNLEFDTLWISAERDPESNTWQWITGNTKEPVSSNMQALIANPILRTTKRACLGFARKNHEIPQFIPLECNCRRPCMCEREKGGNTENSTHPGWITLGKRQYKIFTGPATYNEAEAACFEVGDDVSLAVVINFDHCQKLGRYLLIGRPSLENAWIGARYSGSHFWFETEDLVLSNVTDKTGYPPWRGNHIKKPAGCILLDRHLSNITLFVEARCRRLRPYICYRMAANKSDDYNFFDIIVGDRGYRVHTNQLPWKESLKFCLDRYGANYSGKLVEIQKKEEIFNLLYAMGENRTSVQHIWMGGIFNVSVNPPQWQWASTYQKIDVDELLSWVQNTSYTRSVEWENLCLNMDRENHLQALHYGTMCSYPQTFICSFTKNNLLRLQADERKNSFNDY